MRKITVRQLTTISFLIAMQIVLTRFVSIETFSLRIGFAFIPLALCSMIYGPIIGGSAAAIADIVGFFLFPKAGMVFFIGFTASAFLTGVVYGLFLHTNKNGIVRYILAASVVCLVINLLIDTYWLKILYDSGFFALLPARVLKNIVMIPVQVVLLRLIWQRIEGYVLANIQRPSMQG